MSDEALQSMVTELMAARSSMALTLSSFGKFTSPSIYRLSDLRAFVKQIEVMAWLWRLHTCQPELHRRGEVTSLLTHTSLAAVSVRLIT